MSQQSIHFPFRTQTAIEHDNLGMTKTPSFRNFFISTWVLALLPLMQAAQAQTGQPAERPGSSTVFAALKAGLKVAVTEKAGGLLELQLLNDGKIGTYVVLEIHTSHIVLEDIVAVSKRWIPLTSIQSIVWTRVPEPGRLPAPAPSGR
jgi:hypothetical protein